MQVTLNNYMVNLFLNKYPKYSTTQFVHNDKTLNMQTLLEMVLFTYEVNSQQQKNTTAHDVFCNCPNMGLYREVGGHYPTQYHINKIVQLLCKLGLAEKGEHSEILPNKCVNMVELILGDSESLHEGKYSLEDASKISPTSIASLLLMLPDDAIKILIKEYVVRTNQFGTSAYNNYQGSKNVMRVSDHWNVTDSNRIDMEDGEPISNRWIIGMWNEAKKMYSKHSEYSLFTPSRTLKEKIAIVDELSNKIYDGNPFAVLQLDNFKHQLQGDSSAD